MIRRKLPVIALLLIGLTASNSVVADWVDWWKTPEQQALQAYESGNSQKLIELSPNDSWSGLGQYQSGNYDTASTTFAKRAEQLKKEGLGKKANTALYNQALSDAMNGQYQDAIDHFGKVLETDPGFTDAQENLRIAEQLLEQQKKEQQEGDGGDGEQGDQTSEEEDTGENSQKEQSEESPKQSQEEKSDSDEQQNDQEKSSEDEAQESENSQTPNDSSEDNSSESENQTEAERAQEQEQARKALEAEAKQSPLPEEESDESSASAAAQPSTEKPLSEEEQATEQLLRKIPDDPTGFLRRKLEQSHRNKYPGVLNASKPW